MILSLLLLNLALGAEPEPRSIWVKAGQPAERAQLYDLKLGFAEGQDGAWLNMHADPEGLARLERTSLSWRPDRRQALPGDGYLEPEEMNEALRDLASEHPARVQLVSLGWSVEERPILGVRITDTETPLHTWRILGAHHGDETISGDLALESARWLASSEEGPLAALLARDAVWIVPHVNPDGVAAHTRYNASGIDLNRNYDFEWSPSEFRAGPAPFSEPETRNIRALGSWTSFGAGLSIHSGATNIGWVWNFTEEPTDEADLLEHLADSYGEDCTQGGFWTTNGAEWYITHGDTTDWSFGRYGTLDYTLEVSSEKSPSASDAALIMEQHRTAIENFLDWPWIIGGQVVDANTGHGLPATVTLDGGQPMQSGPTGRFGRPVLDGEHTLTVTAPGYGPVTLYALPGSDPIRIELTQERLAILRPSPALLPANNVVEFTLDWETEHLQLLQPGHPPVDATATPEGWRIDTGGLSPGPWSLIADSVVAPRAIFISDSATQVHIDTIDVGEVDVRVHGEGFGEGTRAWALWGAGRVPIPMAVIEETATEVLLGMHPTTPESGIVDLMILTNGHQSTVVDIFGTEPPVGDEDTGSATDPEEEVDEDLDEQADDEASEPAPIVGADSKLRAVGCSTLPGYPGVALLVSLLGLIPLRRLRCTTS